MGVPQTNRTEAHPNARLTQEQAYAIKFTERDIPKTSLSVKYGVSYQSVCNIQWGKTWAWLKPKTKDVQLDLLKQKT